MMHPVALRDCVSYGGSAALGAFFSWHFLHDFHAGAGAASASFGGASSSSSSSSRGAGGGFPPPGATAALLGSAMFTLHFARRFLEALLVHWHRPAGPRAQPIAVLSADFAGECAYYWGFGLWILWTFDAVALREKDYGSLGQRDYFVNGELRQHGGFGRLRDVLEVHQIGGLITWAWGETVNYWAHRVLAERGRADHRRRATRPPSVVSGDAGDRHVTFPKGFLFNRVSSPHYLGEALSWVGFAGLAQSSAGGNLAAVVFAVVVFAMMAHWGMQRHQAYLEAFGSSYPKRRKAVYPGICLGADFGEPGRAQPNLYRAFYEGPYREPWFSGVFWWAWLTDNENGGPLNTGFTPRGKPAEGVMRKNA